MYMRYKLDIDPGGSSLNGSSSGHISITCRVGPKSLSSTKRWSNCSLMCSLVVGSDSNLGRLSSLGMFSSNLLIRLTGIWKVSSKVLGTRQYLKWLVYHHHFYHLLRVAWTMKNKITNQVTWWACSHQLSTTCVQRKHGQKQFGSLDVQCCLKWVFETGFKSPEGKRKHTVK